MVFNEATGTNYGYLNRKAAGRVGILDLMPDWPFSSSTDRRSSWSPGSGRC